MCAGLGRWWAKCAKTACCPKVFLYSYTRTLGQNSKMTHLGHFWRNRLKVLNAPHSRAWKSAHNGLTRSVKTDLPNGLYRVETLATESDALFTGHFSPTLRFAFKTSAHVQVNSFGEERSFAAFRTKSRSPLVTISPLGPSTRSAAICCASRRNSRNVLGLPVRLIRGSPLTKGCNPSVLRCGSSSLFIFHFHFSRSLCSATRSRDHRCRAA